MNINNQISVQEDSRVQTTMQNKAFMSLLKTINHVITGRFHFSKQRIGEIITMDGGQEYTIFRQVIIDPKQVQVKEPGAILMIRFDFAHGSTKQNQLLSLIPIPFITGLPGFRSKTWALQTVSGGFLGIYEWETIQDAENYKQSFAIKLMTKRAVPGSITFQLIPQHSNNLKGSN